MRETCQLEGSLDLRGAEDVVEGDDGAGGDQDTVTLPVFAIVIDP